MDTEGQQVQTYIHSGTSWHLFGGLASPRSQGSALPHGGEGERKSQDEGLGRAQNRCQAWCPLQVTRQPYQADVFQHQPRGFPNTHFQKSDLGHPKAGLSLDFQQHKNSKGMKTSSSGPLWADGYLCQVTAHATTKHTPAGGSRQEDGPYLASEELAPTSTECRTSPRPS